MKIYLRKSLIVFMIICFFMYVTLPSNRVEANPVVVAAAGVELGVGAYVTSALVVGGLVGLFGYTAYSNEINEHAKRVWNGTQSAIVKGVKVSYEAALSAGNKMMTVTGESYDFIMNQISKEVAFAVPKAIKITESWSKTVEAYAETFNLYIFTPKKGYSFYLWNGENFSLGDVRHNLKVAFKSATTLVVSYNNSNTGIEDITIATVTNPPVTQGMSAEIIYEWVSNNILPGAMTIVPTADIPTYNDYAEKIKKDLVMNPRALPAPLQDDIIARLKTDKAKTLKWNPTDQVWINPTTGVTVPLGDIVFDFPIPKVIGDVVTVPIGGVDTDITTGDTVGDGTTNPPVNPPLDWNQTPTDKLNFEPLKIGAQLTRKFPFSVPWDVGRQLAVFDVSPKVPVIKINKNIPVFGTTMKMNFNIDFTMFDGAIVVVRWFLIILFDIGMILSIRRFMPE